MPGRVCNFIGNFGLKVLVHANESIWHGEIEGDMGRFISLLQNEEGFI